MSEQRRFVPEQQWPDEWLRGRDGLDQMFAVLTGKLDPSQLQAFVVDLSAYNPGDGPTDYYQIWVGNDEQKRARKIHLSLEKGQKVAENLVYFVSHTWELPSGKRYHWLNGYGFGDQSGQLLKLAEGQIDMDADPPVIDFVRWKSLPETLLFDYIQGEEGVTFDDLQSFNLTGADLKWSYYLCGSKTNSKIGFHMGRNPIPRDPEAVYSILPHKDETGRYEWVEIVGEGGVSLGKYLIDRQEKDLIKQWFGPEKQLWIDYLEKKGVTFDQLRPIEMVVASTGSNEDDNWQLYFGNLGKRTVTLTFASDLVKVGDKVVVVPRRDPDGLYEYAEVYRADSDWQSGQVEPIAASLMREGTFSSREWLGIKRQKLCDALKGKIDFDLVEMVELEVRKNNIVNIGLNYKITVKYLALSPGDKVTLQPLSQEADSLRLLLSLNGQPAAEYVFDGKSQTFRRDRLLWREKSGVRRARGYWKDHPEYIREEAAEFVAQYGDLSYPLLKQHGRGDLAKALLNVHVGGIEAMKKELGLGEESGEGVDMEEKWKRLFYGDGESEG